jgi:hypothetical protein
LTHEELFKLAEKAGIGFIRYSGDKNIEKMETFANLIAQHEREACAKIVENEAWQYTSPVWAVEIVNDIRARGHS